MANAARSLGNIEPGFDALFQNRWYNAKHWKNFCTNSKEGFIFLENIFVL